jgi:hypothetical protein
MERMSARMAAVTCRRGRRRTRGRRAPGPAVAGQARCSSLRRRTGGHPPTRPSWPAARPRRLVGRWRCSSAATGAARAPSPSRRGSPLATPERLRGPWAPVTGSTSALSFAASPGGSSNGGGSASGAAWRWITARCESPGGRARACPVPVDGAVAPPGGRRAAAESAARSKASSGWLTRRPPPAGAPATGPLRCCTTWASSWARIRRPSGVAGEYWPARNTRWFPVVKAALPVSCAARSADRPECTRTEEKS